MTTTEIQKRLADRGRKITKRSVQRVLKRMGIKPAWRSGRTPIYAVHFSDDPVVSENSSRIATVKEIKRKAGL